MFIYIYSKKWNPDNWRAYKIKTKLFRIWLYEAFHTYYPFLGNEHRWLIFLCSWDWATDAWTDSCKTFLGVSVVSERNHLPCDLSKEDRPHQCEQALSSQVRTTRNSKAQGKFTLKTGPHSWFSTGLGWLFYLVAFHSRPLLRPLPVFWRLQTHTIGSSGSQVSGFEPKGYQLTFLGWQMAGCGI